MPVTLPENPKERIQAMLELSRGNAVEFVRNGHKHRIVPRGHDPRFYKTVTIPKGTL